MIKKYYIIGIIILVFFTAKGFAIEEVNMYHELKKIDKSGIWKNIWCDGYEIHLCNLPFYKRGTKLFEVENRKFMLIGNRELSPDAKKIAFTLETYKHRAYQNIIRTDLYIMNSDGTNLTKLPTDVFENIFLIGFLGDGKLVLEHSEVENYLHKPETRVIYTIDLNTNKINKFANQKISISSLNASAKGDLLICPEQNMTIVYDVENNATKKMNIKMDAPVLSPDGKKILFRRGDMMGSYYIVNIDGTNEELLLSDEKIRYLLKGSGDYRDLVYASWSPDSRFLLFTESSDLQKGKSFVLDIGSKEIVKIR
ncbi:MAG: hypothetical protein V1674_05085 [Candidatus Omnitrophota bacterium]